MSPIIAAVVAALLSCYTILAITASSQKGLSFDEGLQLAVGYNIWLNEDFRMEGANGDFLKRWATLPYLLTRPAFVEKEDPAWKNARPYDVANRFFFEIENRPESLLMPARAMMTLLGVALGLLVFLWSREIFGNLGGLVSLAFFVLSPAMLAFGGIVSTDMTITFTLFAATWCVWKILHVVTIGRLLASLVVAGALVLAKTSALVILPISALLVLVRFKSGRPLVVQWRDRRWFFKTWRSQSGIIAAVVLLHVMAGWLAIWAHYDFRYKASPNPEDPALVMFAPEADDAVRGVAAPLIRWLEQTRLLPEGFLRGVEHLLASHDGQGAFMNGEWKIGGWRSFFPFAIWVKTPPALFVVLLVGAALWWSRARSRATVTAGAQATEPSPPSRIYPVIPHLVLIGVYLGAAMMEDLNIGHRHVLPIYPSLYILAGAVAPSICRRAIWPGAFVLGSLLWLAVDSLAIRPHYLAYFGAQAGGARNGYKRLVDSSLDWGMNLPGLKRWLEQHNPGDGEKVFLAYFGVDDPNYYGIHAQRLPGFVARRTFETYPLTPGYYAISASLLQGVYTSAFGRWSKEYERLYRHTLRNAQLFDRSATDPGLRAALLRDAPLEEWLNDRDLFDNLRFARLCAWLRHQGAPPHHVGHGIFIWKLDRRALEAALLEPAVELVEAAPIVRRFRRIEVPSQ